MINFMIFLKTVCFLVLFSYICGKGVLFNANKIKFYSPKIAREMKKIFGSETKTVSVKMMHRQAVGIFVRKIEKAHKASAKSSLIFG